MLRSFTALLTQHAAWATSVALHVSAVVAGGHALSGDAAVQPTTEPSVEVEVQLAVLPEPAQEPLEKPTPEPKTEPAARASSGAGHRHAYPVPRSHDAHPHDPSIVHILAHGSLPSPSEPAPLVMAAPSETPLHFVLPAGDGLTTYGGAAPTSRTADPAGESSAATWPESAVDSPARLHTSVPVIYPEGARRAEIEADVLMELVVDAEGHVASARPLTRHGHGLDEAAIRAVGDYHFAPARRDGRPVRVRMRWTVAFRLR